MLQSAKELQGYMLHASDGDLGTIRTFHFDAQAWCIHYLIVDTGGWFSGKYVLLPVEVLGQSDREHQRLMVMLTQEEVRNSPEVPKHPPAPAYDALAMQTYSGRNVYWSTDPLVLQSLAARPASVPIPEPPPDMSDPPPHPVDMQGSGATLRSTREVIGYYIQAMDGPIGHVEDFLIDLDTWHIRYMVVDTRNWLPGRKVLVSPTWIEQISWEATQVAVALPRDRIKNSPEFDPTRPVDRAYETALCHFYDRSRYWE
jgi:hypothetical protein